MRFRGLPDGKDVTEVGVDAELPNSVGGRFRSRSGWWGSREWLLIDEK
jgi:hypothetical protein